MYLSANRLLERVIQLFLMRIELSFARFGQLALKLWSVAVLVHSAVDQGYVFYGYRIRGRSGGDSELLWVGFGPGRASHVLSDVTC